MNSDREIREKLIVGGPEKLSDAHLLAVIIGEGTEALSAEDLEGRVLTEFSEPGTEPGTEPGPGALATLAAAGVQRIRRAAGCGTVRAARIAAAVELARRISAATAARTAAVTAVSSKEDVLRLFAPLAELGHEEFWALYLTSGGRIIDRARLSQGGVAGTVVDHRIVVKRALEVLASSIILVHNHPSGLARPSADDIAVTEALTAAAALFEITVIDHIIISRSGDYSFAENGALPPKRS